MTNGEWMVEQGIKFSELSLYKPKYNEEIRVSLHKKVLARFPYSTRYDIVLQKWLDEKHDEPILTYDEWDCLKAMTKPWKQKICYIRKIDCGSGSYVSIALSLPDGGLNEFYRTPDFPSDAMFTGMGANRMYCLEDLGLDKEKYEPFRD